jgi:cytochrome oxidase assembly protein ShyY1
LPDASILVGPVTLGSVPGVRVLTPLRLEPADGSVAAGETLVLVDRGFVPAPEIETFRASDSPGLVSGRTGVVRAFTRDSEPAAFGNAPAVELREQATRAPQTASDAAPRHRWLRFDPGNATHVRAVRQQLGERLAPILVQLEAEAATLRPIAGFDRPRSPVDHRGYALIWFASAAACFASWIEFGRRRARDSSGGS